MSFMVWLRALSAVGAVAEASRLFRAPRGEAEREPAVFQPGSTQLEARLAQVVVAALKEAFNRDRARFDLEQGHLDAQRERAEQQLRLEWLRQESERALGQVRMMAIMSLIVWAASALLLVWLPGSQEATSKVPTRLRLECVESAAWPVRSWRTAASRSGSSMRTRQAR